MYIYIYIYIYIHAIYIYYECNSIPKTREIMFCRFETLLYGFDL